MEKKNNTCKGLRVFLFIVGICGAIAGACVLAARFIKKHMRFSLEIFEDEEDKKTLENDIKITPNPIEDPEE